MAQAIERWKSLYDEDPIQSKSKSSKNLAVDPSDVFGLKGLKE